MVENNPTTEKISPQTESIPAEQSGIKKNVENIDFQNLNQEKEASKKAQEQAALDIKNTSANSASSAKAISMKEVEEILSGDLGDIYTQMPPEVQQEFKQKGEETTKKIHALLQQPKVKIKKIASLIMDWLKIIPGVNKFFLEQESKIKTDKVLKL